MGIEIALALGLSGIVATVGGAVINAGIGLALSFGAQKLLGKKTSSGQNGVRLSLEVAADVPRQAIIGETAVAGSLVYWHLRGDNNEHLHMVIALADHECDSLQGVIVNGELREWNPATGVVSDTNEKLLVRFHSGAPGQVADATLINTSNGYWTEQHRGTGVCYVGIILKYGEKAWPGGIPQLAFVVRGHNKLFDPRTGLLGYSDNWGVAVYNALIGIRQTVAGPRVAGMHAVADSVNLADAIAAINASDEDVFLGGGGTEKRYRVGVALRSDMTAREVLETLLAAGGGELVESAGLYRILAGVAQSPVAALTDGDLLLEQPLTFEPHQTRAELVNTIEASYASRQHGWVQTPLPARVSSGDVDADGGVRLVRTLDLTACPSYTQAQRVMEIERRRARRQGRATFSLRSRWQGLEPGDWITLTSERRGWIAKTFQIARVEELPSGALDLQLAETDAGLDDWETGFEIADGAAADLPSATPINPLIGGLLLYPFLAEAVGGAQRPGLRLFWEAVSDPTTVSLLLEYRKTGDAVALQRQILEPDAGSYAWVSGVQGGLVYEARVRPITQPDRDVEWSAWVQAPEPSPADVVLSAAVALAVPPDTITPEMLSEQARFELALTTALDDVQGSVAAKLAAVQLQFERVASALDLSFEQLADTEARVTVTQQTQASDRLALAQQITEALASLDLGSSAVFQALEARVEDTEAGLTSQASLIEGVQTTLGDHSAGISSSLTAIDGISAKWTLQLDANGFVTDLVTAGGVAGYSFFGVMADAFFIAKPGTLDGDPQQIFTLTTGGTPRLVFAGDFMADGSVTAQHLDVATLEAISADLGKVTAGEIQGAKFYMNLDTGEWWIDA